MSQRKVNSSLLSLVIVTHRDQVEFHPVFDLSGEGWGIYPPLVEDDPLTGDCTV